MGYFGGWRRVAVREFVEDAPLGSWATADGNLPEGHPYHYSGGQGLKVYADGWGYPGDHGVGKYMPGQTTSAEDGVLKIRMLENGGEPLSGAVIVDFGDWDDASDSDRMLQGDKVFDSVRFRVRARLSGGAGWGAVLVGMPQDGDWPADGELNWFETQGPDWPAQGWFHFADAAGSKVSVAHAGRSADAWRWWEMEWVAGSHVAYKVDGRRVAHFTDRIPPRGRMLVTVQCGLRDGEPLPAGDGLVEIDRMEVFVRVP